MGSVTLGRDMLCQVFSFLNEKELCKVGRVCKNWQTLANANILWKALYLRRFQIVEMRDHEIEWKTQFHQNYKFLSLHQATRVLSNSTEGPANKIQIECAHKILKAVMQDNSLCVFFRIDQHTDGENVKGYDGDVYQQQMKPLLATICVKILEKEGVDEQMRLQVKYLLEANLQWSSTLPPTVAIADSSVKQKVAIMQHFVQRIIPIVLIHKIDSMYLLSAKKIAIPVQVLCIAQLEDPAFTDFSKTIFLTMLYYVRKKL